MIAALITATACTLICALIGWSEHDKAIAARHEADLANEEARRIRELLKFQRRVKSEAGKRAHATQIHNASLRNPLRKQEVA